MRYLLLALLLLASPAHAEVYRYVVVANLDDDKLLLVDAYGENFIVEARVYCWEHRGFARGNILLSSENLDLCVSSTLISVKTGESCEVWCP